MSDLFVGSTIAGCRLDAVAGRGGMGVVYRATQLALNRPVALKAMAPQLATDTEYRERFERESHLAASIDHPNVIPVYEAGESDGTLYLIMRWVRGTDLRALLTDSGRLDPAQAVRLLRPVASALAAAHRRGLVHRDIKPANVLIAEGEADDDEHVYLTDFGIAKRTDTEGGMTRTGVLVGTIDYTAPERIEGGGGTPASDIYAFGCMLYETLTGHVPFERATELLKMYAHMNDPPPNARAEASYIPEALDAIITTAMAKRPEERFGSAGQLASALSSSLEPTAPGRASAEHEPASGVPTELLAETVGPQTPATPAPQTPALQTPATRTPATPPTQTSAAPAAQTPAAPTPQQAPEATGSGEAEPPTALVEPGHAGPGGPPPGPSARRPSPRSRRPLYAALALLALVVVVVIVIASSGGGGGHRSAAPAAMTADQAGNVWVSRPGDGTLTRIDPSGQKHDFHVGGAPKLLAAGPAGIWESDGRSLVLRDAGAHQRARATLPAAPVALAVSPMHGSAWALEPDGTIENVDANGGLAADPPKVTPSPRAITLGAGWLWAVGDGRLTRIGTLGTHPMNVFDAGGPQPVAVTSDSGIWMAHADGLITRFDPRPSHFGVNTKQRVASELNQIAAVDGGPFVWATSAGDKTLYKLTVNGTGTAQKAASFTSPPVALAVLSHSVWVATKDGKLAQITF
jgi:tRNA A-37 threonylcarbamoyl transferase component Bud32